MFKVSSQLNNALNIIDPFSPPCEIWEYRRPTHEEIMAHYDKHGNFQTPMQKVKLLKTISNHHEAATYQLKQGATEIELHIDNYLSKNKDFKNWRSFMPSPIPKEISNYQSKYNHNETYDDVSTIIKDSGIYLPDGQCVFHGGDLPYVNGKLTILRPLSTSFCPQVALREAEHNYKAFHAGKIEIVVLRVKNPKTKAYVFRITGTNMCHEKEILFASGANISVKDCKKINDSYTVSTPFNEHKEIPAFIITAEIS